MPTLDRQDNIFVLDLGAGENRFHPDWIDSVNTALDEVEKADGPRGGPKQDAALIAGTTEEAGLRQSGVPKGSFTTQPQPILSDARLLSSSFGS